MNRRNFISLLVGVPFIGEAILRQQPLPMPRAPQVILVPAGAIHPVEGTFTLSIGDRRTSPLPFNATQEQIQAAVDSLFR